MTADKTHHTGRCLCGAVQFEVHGPLIDTHACHCGQCRRQSGHFVVGTGAKRTDFEITKNQGLKWHQSSEWAKRGFCGECGSAMFWDGPVEEIGINVGCLDQPTGLKMTHHIFVADKGDYYEIDDDLPKFADLDTPMEKA